MMLLTLGAVELEGLRIRKDALREFDLPGIEVKWGYIGKITLRIPSYRNYRLVCSTKPLLCIFDVYQWIEELYICLAFKIFFACLECFLTLFLLSYE